MKKVLLLSGLLWACSVFLQTATGAAAPAFTQLTLFPTPPAGFTTLADALTSGQNAGRFVLWDGDRVFIERNNIGSGDFKLVASGIFGDPSFMSVHPDGKRVLLGAGKCDISGSGLMFLLDTDVDIDAGGFTSLPAPLNVTPIPIDHFAGVWLNSTQVLIDACVTFGQAELILYDLAPFFASAANPIVKTVVTNKGMFSAFLSINAARTSVFVGDGGTGETHQLNVAALVNAFNTNTPIDWTVASANNLTLGTFTPGGPGAVTAAGTILFGNFTPQVLFALPPLYTNTASTDPAGTGLNSYSVAYNPVTDEVLAIGLDFSTFPLPPLVTGWLASPLALPASRPWGLLLMTCLVLTAGAWILVKKKRA